jgi:NTP pyrophosphatase (non-canonical NTP hydrolase)
MNASHFYTYSLKQQQQIGMEIKNAVSTLVLKTDDITQAYIRRRGIGPWSENDQLAHLMGEMGEFYNAKRGMLEGRINEKTGSPYTEEDVEDELLDVLFGSVTLAQIFRLHQKHSPETFDRRLRKATGQNMNKLWGRAGLI